MYPGPSRFVTAIAMAGGGGVGEEEEKQGRIIESITWKGLARKKEGRPGERCGTNAKWAGPGLLRRKREHSMS